VLLHVGSQLHWQVDWLQIAPGAHPPPQSDGHWQLQAAVLQARGLLHAPPQSAAHSQAQVPGLH
jgi:hypothetical protein